MNRRTWRRWAATLAATAAALLGAALATAPAHADPASGPVLTFDVTQNPLGLQQPADPNDWGEINWGLTNGADGGTAKDVQVTIDVTGITSFADVRGNCTDGLCTFPVRDIAADGQTGSLLDVNAKPGAKLGSTGTAKLLGTSSNGTVVPMDVTVTVGNIGLDVNFSKQVDGAKPGSTLTAPLTVANIGSLDATGVDYRFAISPGLAFAQRFGNCDYGTTDQVGDSDGQTIEDAVCHFGAPVKAGRKYTLSTPLKLKVKDSALFEYVSYDVKAAGSALPSTAKSGGPTLSLVDIGPATSGSVEHALWVVNSANTADFAVTGDRATAAPGTETTLTAKVVNHGPASVDLLTTDDQPSLLVDIPKGTTATKVPPSCGPWSGDGKGEPKLGAPQYICDLDRPFDAGHSQSLAFTVKVDADAPATTSGEVRPQLAYGGDLPYDTDLSNSVGHFTVTVPGGATAPGGSSSGGGSGSGANRPTTQTGASTGSTGGAGTDPTGSLASTGSGGTLTVAWTGAAALALGGALFAAVRSRRARARG